MSETTADVIARLQERLRPHAASPVTARRKATDASSGRANAGGVTTGYGSANSLSSRKRGGRYPNSYRPRAKDFAGMDAPTTRPAYGSVKPSNGIRVAKDDRAANGMPLAKARAAGEDNEYRAWTSARTNLARDAGDVIEPAYPAGRSNHGRLSPGARY